MTKKYKVDRLAEFDMAQYLKSNADIAEYLRQVLEEGDPASWLRLWVTLPRPEV